MKRNLGGFMFLGLSLSLFACTADGISSIATPSTQPITGTTTGLSGAVAETFTPVPAVAETFMTPTPFETPTQLATATTAVVPTATSTPSAISLVRVEGMAVNGSCVELDDTVVFPIQMFNQPNFEVDMEAYLNAGGAISDLPQALAATDVDQAIRMQIMGQDVTGSGIPDLLMGITIPYEGGSGETHLLFFTCIEAQYEGTVLFRRAGAGSRAEGLYEGGGVEVEDVRDMNGNGRQDVLFSVKWPEYGEHYLLEWEGGQFVSLIEYRGELGETRYWIETKGEEVEIDDMEGDGVYEIVVVGEENVDEVPIVWRWDGQRYSREPGE
jgi:hypothetical protein